MDLSSLPRPVGFVLGGGGSLGAVQVGMLQALAEQGVVPDLVVGTSVGALNGAVVGLDPRGAASRLRRIWPRITRPMVFPGGPLAQARTLRQGRTYLFPNIGLRAVITGYLHADMTFAELALPFGAVTMDLATAAPHVLRDGPLVPALLASAAIPGLFPPVRIDGRQLYDGGVVANVPVTQALAMGARSLVVLDAAFPGRLPTPPTTLAEALLFTAIVSMRVQAALEAPIAAAHVPVVYLPGPAIHRVSPLQFHHTDMLIKGAYQAARPFLERLEIDGPGLYGSPSGH
jgi:NTE family protein